MLYYLFQWLDKYDIPGAGMFGYTSFRALMAIIAHFKHLGRSFYQPAETETDYGNTT